MAINIKNPEAERLARDLAARTGVSLTEAVVVALRERAERVHAAEDEGDSASRVQRILDVARAMGPLPEPWRSTGHGDLLYDDLGLPR